MLRQFVHAIRSHINPQLVIFEPLSLRSQLNGSDDDGIGDGLALGIQEHCVESDSWLLCGLVAIQ